MSKKIQKQIDQELLNNIFSAEREWKQLRKIVDKSIDPLGESRQMLKLTEAKYMFLLREAKHRKISVLRYD